MNNRFVNIFTLIASSTIFLVGCGGDNSSFETPNADISSNPGIVSQKNFSILAENVQPAIIDPLTGLGTDTTLVITVKIGDKNNQLLTDTHTVFFETEWGLIEPSCITQDGICTVNWQTSFGSTLPIGNLTTITAYTLGEEHFSDTNGNGVFDDDDTPFPSSGDLFTDREEPFVDADMTDGVFNASFGDKIIDVMNGLILGTNSAHDDADGFLNSPSCTHSSLCSTIRQTIFVWVDIELDMNGPP